MGRAEVLVLTGDYESWEQARVETPHNKLVPLREFVRENTLKYKLDVLKKSSV